MRVHVAALVFVANGLVSSWACAGGGWVGNAPALDSFRLAQSQTLNFEQQRSQNAWLRRGQDRGTVSVGYGFSPHDDNAQIGLNFDMGLSDRWNLLSFTTLEYALSDSSSNDENAWVLMGGLVESLGYSSRSGLTMGPGLAALHEWKQGDWAWTNLVSVSSVLCTRRCGGALLHHTALDYGILRWRTGLARSFDESWSVAASTESYVGYGSNRKRTKRGWNAGYLVANPSLALSHSFDADDRLALNLGFEVGGLDTRAQHGVSLAFNRTW
jgi:hypothetical protein